MSAAQFSFDTGFQRAVLRLMMIDNEFALKSLKWLEPGYFTTPPLGWMFKATQEHWRSYNTPMTDIVVRDYVRRLDAARAGRFGHEVELVIALGNVPEEAYVKARLKEFVQQAIFATAHEEAATLFNAGKSIEAYDLMAQAQESIQDVGFEKVDRIWVFDSLLERQKVRENAALDVTVSPISTGLPPLDDLTDGGVHPGELWAVLAYAKRCKTTWLINQGFNATRIHQRPTVHFVLEGRGSVIASRYDSCFSQELYAHIRRGQIATGLYQQLMEEYSRLRKLLVIRTLNEWDVTILDIQGELSYLKGKGFVPDVMIVDYMDLGRARTRVESELQHQVSFARDLKRLVNNLEVSAWSAWQAQRPKPGAHTKEHVLSSANVADAYAKVRIVNAFGSLNATDEEMEQNEMRVFWEGHRDAPVNKVWRITNDLARMRMLTQQVTEQVTD